MSQNQTKIEQKSNKNRTKIEQKSNRICPFDMKFVVSISKYHSFNSPWPLHYFTRHTTHDRGANYFRLPEGRIFDHDSIASQLPELALFRDSE